MKPSKLGPLTCKQEASCQKLWGVFQLIPNLLTITKVNSKRSKNETNICSQAFVFLQLEYCNSLLSGHSLLSSWFKMQQLSFLLVLADGIILPRSWLISFGSLYALELIFKLYSSLLKHVAVWLQATWQIRWLHMSLRSSNASLQNQGSSLEVTIGTSWNWKNLPEEVKLATSITSFKSLVKAHFYELSLEQCQFSLFSPS